MNLAQIQIWIIDNWFNLLQALGIIAGLLFSGLALRTTNKSIKAQVLLQITQQHREIWFRLFTQPELRRINKTDVDLNVFPITEDERLFLSMLILHMSAVVQAGRLGSVIPIERQSIDIGAFFSLPIPNTVWKKSKHFQNSYVCKFVEDCIKNHKNNNSKPKPFIKIRKFFNNFLLSFQAKKTNILNNSGSEETILEDKNKIKKVD